MDVAYKSYIEALDNEKAGGGGELTVKKLKEAIDNGSVEAAYALGSLHLHGRHVEKDPEKAMALLTIATKNMYVPALMDVALGSERGDLLPEDHALAFRSYFLAMLSGNVDALYEVGRCFYYGIGVNPSERIFDIIMEMHDWKKNQH